MRSRMNSLLRTGLLAGLCIGVAGCAILPAAGIGLAASGAQGLVALTLVPLANMQERSEQSHCLTYTNNGISVTESLETRIPSDEGVVTIFESASWRPEFAREGYPQVERSRTPTEGTLAISERSALLMPPPGSTSVRIPYELVQNVEVHRTDGTGEPRYMIVNSCFGRFDIVMFLRRHPDSLDPEATTAAAAQLKSRVAAFHTATNN